LGYASTRGELAWGDLKEKTEVVDVGRKNFLRTGEDLG